VQNLFPLKSVYRKAVYCLVRSGLLDLKHNLAGYRDIILTFHKIRPIGQTIDPFDTCPSISAGVFRQILEYVKSRYEIIPLYYLLNPSPKKTARVVITFDDGWRDNFDIAYPILHEMEIPATIFVVTGKIGSTVLFWQQSLGNLFRQAIDGSSPILEQELRNVFCINKREPLNSMAYKRTVAHCKRMPLQNRVAILDQLKLNDLDYSSHSRLFLNAAEILEMSKNGIDFGSHTVNHFILPQQSSTVINQELSESKLRLEKILGKSIDMLAYPNGNVSEEVIQSAEKIGYRIGCTVRRGRVLRHDNYLTLPRIEPPWDDIDSRKEFNDIMFKWCAR
jgi:peptidoglycan/xylan/chitin deacetylase (PgdA/CDA1 family)